MADVHKGFVVLLKPIYKYHAGSWVTFLIGVVPSRGGSVH